MNQTPAMDFVWELYRDGIPFSKAVSHEHAQKVIAAMKRAFPGSKFTARYIGRSYSYTRFKEVTE